jgi:hypothetical protein
MFDRDRTRQFPYDDDTGIRKLLSLSKLGVLLRQYLRTQAMRNDKRRTMLTWIALMDRKV